MDVTVTKSVGDSMQIDGGSGEPLASGSGPTRKSGSALIRSRDEMSSSGSSDEPPLKKPRIEESPSGDKSNKSMGMDLEKRNYNGIGKLTVEQQEFSERVLNAVMKLPAAVPFLQPVDPVSVNAPDYFDVIKRPIDLGTISKRLRLRKGSKDGQPYSTLQEFVDDVNLVFDNCFRYNGSKHAVSQLAIRVKDKFEKSMRDAPNGSLLVFVPVPDLGGKMPPTSDAIAQPTSSPSPVLGRKRSFLPSKSFTPSPSLGPRSRRDPLRIAQEKFCKSVLDHLYKKENLTWVNPFLRPVDLDRYPTYRQVISRPMDLGTVQDKLSHGVYGSAEEFHGDVKLIFSNCYAFNPEWSPYGTELEKIFDQKWKELPIGAPENDTTPTARRNRSSAGSSKSQQRSNQKESTPRGSTKSAPEVLTEDQQLELCDILATISDAKMNRVIALIRKNLPQYRDNEETVSLEFEEIPLAVQAEMFSLVKRLTAPKEGQRQAQDDSDSTSTGSDEPGSDGSFDSDDAMQ